MSEKNGQKSDGELFLREEEQMKTFDTKVQYLKYKVLREVARHAYDDTLLTKIMDIPAVICPGPEPTTRCCVYKERAIIGDRIKLAMGGDAQNENVIELIPTACDECPVGGYEVTNACRGCIAHRCEQACKRGAITYDSEQKAHIDKSKCVECGMCEKACPYHAITNYRRPCEQSCKIGAISMDADKLAHIDNKKCTSCGACVYMCPFGAISDKSFILNVIDYLKKSENNSKYKVYAVIAPSISSQFSYAKTGQVVSGLRELGFFHVVEAALGADMVAYREAAELAEKGTLTSSCCPAFVKFIKTQYPSLSDKISSNLSPMATIAKYIKQTDESAKIVFVGPCTAKKAEIQLESVKPYVDSVITFEELQALFDARDIDIASLEETPLDNASYYGRIFARSGGLKDAVAQALKEQGLSKFEYKPISCDGIEECRKSLLLLSKGVNNFNFIEGMACEGGCIGGAGCLTHGVVNKAKVDIYGKEAFEKTISEAISVYKI